MNRVREHRLRRAVGVVQRRTMPIALERKLSPVQPRTMVEQAAEAIVNAAARGVFLPGDRLVEAEIARELTISRVPVREALRLLESHGVVIATPYKGMRLAELSNDRVRQLTDVRRTLETMAIREVRERDLPAEEWQEADRLLEALKQISGADDIARVNELDVALHTELFRLSDNVVLIGLWQSLSRQVLILCALTRVATTAAQIAQRAEAVLDAVKDGDATGLDEVMTTHLAWLDDFDAEGALAALRKPKRTR